MTEKTTRTIYHERRRAAASLCDEAFEEIESAMDYVEFDLEIVEDPKKAINCGTRIGIKFPLLLSTIK